MESASNKIAGAALSAVFASGLALAAPQEASFAALQGVYAIELSAVEMNAVVGPLTVAELNAFDTVALSTVMSGAYRNTATVGRGIKPTRASFQLRLGSGVYLEPTVAFSLGGAAPDFSLSVNLPISF